MTRSGEDRIVKGEVTISRVGDYQLIAFKGDLVYSTVESLKQNMEKISIGSSGYIFDMTGVSRIDSTGFGVIVNLSKRLFMKETKIVFIVNNQLIYNLFVISQFHKVFTIVKNLDEAKKILDSGTDLKMAFTDYLNMSNRMRKE